MELHSILGAIVFVLLFVQIITDRFKWVYTFLILIVLVVQIVIYSPEKFIQEIRDHYTIVVFSIYIFIVTIGSMQDLIKRRK